MSLYKRAGMAAISIAVAGSGVVAVAPTANAANIYANCTALHHKWKHGVGRTRAHDHTSGTPVTNFYHSTRQYKIAMHHNSRLDADKDGVACEAR